MSDSQKATGGKPAWRRYGVPIAIVAVVVGVLFFFGREAAAYFQEHYVVPFSNWVEELGPWGPIAFIALYVLATVAFFPGSLLTLLAGLLFGLLWGTVWVFIGATLGAIAAFLVSRYLARGAVEKRLEGNAKFRQIHQAVGRRGRTIVFLLRLSPVIPFNLLNYALGLTQVRFVDYAVASIGMLPATFLYVYYGKSLGSVTALAAGEKGERGSEQWIFLGLGLVATIVVSAVITRIAHRALQDKVDDA